MFKGSENVGVGELDFLIYTNGGNSKRAKVCAELVEAGATPDQIIARASAWPAHFDSATLTETALMNHWDTLGRRPLRRTR